MHYLAHIDALLAIVATFACIVYAIKNRNNYTPIFIYTAVVTGYVAVLYVLMTFDMYISGEWFRVAWFWFLLIPIIMTIALWGIGKNGYK